MKDKTPYKKIICYHYTNPLAFMDMSPDIEDGKVYSRGGLRPMGSFIRTKGLIKENERDLPPEAYKPVIQGLLEPEPESWTNNPEISDVWDRLMFSVSYQKSDVWETNEIMLISFDVLPKDKAYVVEAARVQKYLDSHREAEADDGVKEAFRKYWESRIPAYEYKGGYSLPQLAIWSRIEFKRLNVEWDRHVKEVWERVEDKNRNSYLEWVNDWKKKEGIIQDK